jgi:hypothetical protein
LLFLTNLRAQEIVLAKAVAHGLRALTLWLATIPLIAVPVLLGGLSWEEIVFSCTLALASILFALSVGVFASACARRINGAVGLTAVLIPWAFLLFTLLFMVLTNVPFVLFGLQQWANIEWWEAIFDFSGLIWNIDDDWKGIMADPKVRTVMVWSLASLLPLAALIGFVVVRIVAVILRRTWQDRPKTRRQTEVEHFFFAPVFWTGLFRTWMRRSLEGNPIGWLEKRRVSGRIMSWIWLAIMISFATTLAYGGLGVRAGEFNPLMWLLLATLAYVAAGSFRRERETGALELILVTPISERQIILGRLRGLWSQFLLTFLLWAGVVIYLSTALDRWRPDELIQFTTAYLVVPVVGLYFSLRSRFVLLAWLATLTACFALPRLVWWFCYAVFDGFFGSSDWRYLLPLSDSDALFVMLPAQIGLAILLLWRLKVNLVRRSFAMR